MPGKASAFSHQVSCNFDHQNALTDRWNCIWENSNELATLNALTNGTSNDNLQIIHRIGHEKLKIQPMRIRMQTSSLSNM